jgi:hypothetical protein
MRKNTDDACIILELILDDDDRARVWLHAIEGVFRGAVLAEFTEMLGLVVDALAREAVAGCMPVARALESERARYAALRKDVCPWLALPRRLPAHCHIDAHVLYLEYACEYMCVPGTLPRLLAAWELREPVCACPVKNWAFTPSPPREMAQSAGVRLFCQRCWRVSA